MQLRNDGSVNSEVRYIRVKGRAVPLLIISPKNRTGFAPGVLWIHGGGYFLGMKEMAYMSRAVDLVKKFGAVVISPGYRLAFLSPFPAAIEDCYGALLFMKKHAHDLGIRHDQLMVGGESAGGGLAASLCMLARDRGTVNIAFQMPLYPMIDNLDTETSRDNHAKVWNTKTNHIGWRMYLREKAKKKVSPYAAAARQTNFSGLPPCYTFVGTAEPFYAETLTFIENLKKAGVNADVDVFNGMVHAFDMLQPELKESQEAIKRFDEHFKYAMENYFCSQGDKN